MTNGAEYMELHANSAFSFLSGASQPEAIIERAAELEMPAIALADRNGIYGMARFHSTAIMLDIVTHGTAGLGQRPAETARKFIQQFCQVYTVRFEIPFNNDSVCG